jgi:hypothetical protein
VDIRSALPVGVDNDPVYQLDELIVGCSRNILGCEAAIALAVLTGISLPMLRERFFPW